MNYYIICLGSNEQYDALSDKVLQMFGTLHIFLSNDIKAIEIRDHEINQNIYEKLSKIIDDLDATVFIFKGDPDQMDMMCGKEVETIPTLTL